MTSCTSAVVAPSPVVIDGIATLTMKKSSGARKAPVRRIASAAQRWGSGTAGAVGMAGIVMVAILMVIFIERSVPNWTKKSVQAPERLIDDIGHVLFAGAGSAQHAQALHRAVQLARDRPLVVVAGNLAGGLPTD